GIEHDAAAAREDAGAGGQRALEQLALAPAKVRLALALEQLRDRGPFLGLDHGVEIRHQRPHALAEDARHGALSGAHDADERDGSVEIHTAKVSQRREAAGASKGPTASRDSAEGSTSTP